MKLDLDLALPAGLLRGQKVPFGVCGETDRLAEVLLCRPSYLSAVPCCSVTREQLRGGFSVSVERALAQHRGLQASLERHGISCRILPARPDLPDLCFTRDAAVMTPWGLLALNPAMPHRRNEVAEIERFAWYASVPLLGAIEQGQAEGGDICVARPGLVLIGCSGERTDEAGAEAVAAIFQAHGWDAHIYRFDPHFLHLDTQFCMVAEDLALACTDVLGDDFLAILDAEGIETIDVSYKEARALGCNVLALGERHILSSAANTRVNRLLRGRGFDVDEVDIAQFTACGGGLHCLTLPLARIAGTNPA
jgi:N-dimethylarginine dimethylaminohydrolase